MKFLYAVILVLIAETACGESNLPACQGSDATKWTNCYGNLTLTYPISFTYLGEFKDGMRSGYGVITSVNGPKYEGDFKQGNLNGQGYVTYANGDKYVCEWNDGILGFQGSIINGKRAKDKCKWLNDKPEEQEVLPNNIDKPQLLEHPYPEYPAVSRRANEQGKVIIKLLIDEVGSPQKIMLSSSSGFPRLDQAAINTVKTWKFTPPKEKTGWFLVPISFEMKNDDK